MTSTPPTKKLKLEVLRDTLMVCRLDAAAAIPPWAMGGELVSVTRTDDELSIVCREGEVHQGVRCERGWRGLKVSGPLDFSLVGILASLTEPLAQHGISVFAISTYDTDYLLVREKDFEHTKELLAAEGHQV